MAVKKTTEQIVTAYRIIDKAKLTKMEDADKFAFIKMVRQLKKTTTDFDDFLKDAQERLKSEDFSAIVNKIQNGNVLTEEENKAVQKYNSNVNECVKDELGKEVELECGLLSEKAFESFISSNDFSVNEILSLSEVITG